LVSAVGRDAVIGFSPSLSPTNWLLLHGLRCCCRAFSSTDDVCDGRSPLYCCLGRSRSPPSHTNQSFRHVRSFEFFVLRGLCVVFAGVAGCWRRVSVRHVFPSTGSRLSWRCGRQIRRVHLYTLRTRLLRLISSLSSCEWCHAASSMHTDALEATTPCQHCRCSRRRSESVVACNVRANKQSPGPYAVRRTRVLATRALFVDDDGAATAIADRSDLLPTICLNAATLLSSEKSETKR